MIGENDIHKRIPKMAIDKQFRKAQKITQMTIIITVIIVSKVVGM